MTTLAAKDRGSPLKILQVHCFYEAYLEGFYSRQPQVGSQSFAAQIEALVRDGFSGLHMVAPYMADFGYEATLAIANNMPSQLQWLRENGYTDMNAADWLKETVRRQVETIKPDILYIEPLYFDASFLRSLPYQPKLVVGWRAADIPEGIDWNGFDIIFSSLSGLREVAIERGAKDAVHHWPGVPEWIYPEIEYVTPHHDVVFIGQWTERQHQQRNAYLQSLIENAATGEPKYRCGFHLSGLVDRAPRGVQDCALPPAFGVDMHRAIRSGRIGFDSRAKHRYGEHRDIGRNDTANMRIFEVTSSRVMLLTEYFDNLSEIFEPGVEVETFRDADELIEKVRYYVAHPEKREEIAERGFERCMRDHSMTERIRKLDVILRAALEKKFPSESSVPEVSVGAVALPYEEASGKVDEPLPRLMALLNRSSDAAALSLVEAVETQGGAIATAPGFLFLKAVALGREGRVVEACAVLDELLASCPEHGFAAVLRIELEAALPDAREELIEAVNSPNPKEADRLVTEAIEMLQQERFDDAFSKIQGARTFSTEVRDLHYVEAIYRFSRGEDEEGIALLEAELALFPDNDEARSLLSSAHGALQQETVS